MKRIGEHMPKSDTARLSRLKTKLEAGSQSETLRRVLIFTEVLLDHQEHGGDIVLCKQGKADKAVWIL